MNTARKISLKRFIFWATVIIAIIPMIVLTFIGLILAILEEACLAIWACLADFEAWCFKERNAREGYRHIGDGLYRGGYTPEDD